MTIQTPLMMCLLVFNLQLATQMISLQRREIFLVSMPLRKTVNLLIIHLPKFYSLHNIHESP